jgi:hypothetical protein
MAPFCDLKSRHAHFPVLLLGEGHGSQHHANPLMQPHNEAWCPGMGSLLCSHHTMQSHNIPSPSM